MKTMKKFIFGLTALLGVSVFLIGCPTDAETKTVTNTVTDMIHLDVVATTLSGLEGYLEAEGDLAIGVLATGGVTLTADLPVPDGKVVYILSGTTLDVDAYDLTVEGIVYVGVDATLSAASTGVVKALSDKRVYVTKGGTLEVKDRDSVVNDEDEGALGTAVGFSDESKLIVSGLSTIASVEDYLGYTKGKLSVTLTSITPSAVITAATEGSFLLNERLSITANGTETPASLTVPAGLKLATTNAFASGLTTLTVNGTFTASAATLATLNANVSGTGTLVAGVVDAGTAKFVVESTTLASASIASTTITDADLEIPAGKTRIFTGAAAPSGTVTVKGTAIFTGAAAPVGDTTVDAGGVLSVGSTGTYTVPATGTKTLVLTGAAGTGGAKLIGAGKVVSGSTEIIGGTGGWQAVGTGTVTIQTTAAATASITASAATAVLTAVTGTTQPSITQLAGSSSELTIATNTEIALGGTATAVGSIVLTKGSDPAKLIFGAAGAKVTTGNSSGSALSGAGGVFAASNSTDQDKIPVSAYSGSDYVTITGGNNALTSIVFGAGTAYITGPKNASGNNATVSAVTDCTT